MLGKLSINVEIWWVLNKQLSQRKRKTAVIMTGKTYKIQYVNIVIIKRK